jgi:hypothetical protein
MTFYEEGLLDSIAETRCALRSDRVPEVWRAFCRDYWFQHCRPGEKMRDKMRNPKDRSDLELYDIYFRERLIQDLYSGCMEEGLEAWPETGIFADDDIDTHHIKEGFDVSERVFRDERPFNVKDTTRDQCLCIWHLRFEYLDEGFYHYWQARRTAAKHKCDCPHLKSGTSLRHYLMCPRPEGESKDKLGCVNQACSMCKDIKRLRVCDKCMTAFEGHDIGYQIFGKREFTRQRGKRAVDPDWTLNESRQTGAAVETKPDFVLCHTPFADFHEYLEAYWPVYIAHHDLSKHQDDDWEQQRKNFPRGTFVSTQDFSENYHHQARKEFQSAYFVEIGSTVYGMVIRVHLADIGTEAELIARGEEPVITDAERAILEQMFKDLDEPAILTISHIVISSDLIHDEAMVQHCNDVILIPWMEKIKASGVTWVRHHARSDGCKKQFKDGTQFLWISKCHERTGIHLEWNFFCSCHGKDISDPECGTCKIYARKRELEHTEARPTRIRTALDLKDLCEGKPEGVKGLIWPTRTVFKKRGRGIFRRYFHFVPAAGVGAVNRRIPKGATVEGSSRLHVFADVGVAGHLKVRERGCHKAGCPCWSGRYAECEQVPRDPVLGLAQASHPLLCHHRQIAEDSAAERSVPLTRNYLCNRGIEMSQDVEEGDIVAVFVDDLSECWMLGRVRRVVYTITEADAEYTWMGSMHVGDRVIYVHKLEPVSGGLASAFFKLKEGAASQFPVWIEDLRAIKIKLKQDSGVRRSARMAAAGPANPLDIRWELSAQERERVLITLPLAYNDVSVDPHKAKRRPATFVAGDD